MLDRKPEMMSSMLIDMNENDTYTFLYFKTILSLFFPSLFVFLREDFIVLYIEEKLQITSVVQKITISII